MQAMEARLQSDFLDHTAEKLASQFPERARELGRPEVRKIAAAGLASGMRFGLEERPELECFIHWTFEHGPQFEARPEWLWLRNILEDAELRSDAKIMLIRSRLENGPARSR